MGLFRKMTLACMAGMACWLGAVGPEAQGKSSEIALESWREFHSVAGSCSMMFPSIPEHVSEKMAMPEEGYELKYDAYISALDPQTVFMLLVAQYPDFVDESYAQMSLEGFLNGILTHNPLDEIQGPKLEKTSNLKKRRKKVPQPLNPKDVD